jgi:hypothetical protein
MNERDVVDLAWIPVFLYLLYWLGRKADAAIAEHAAARDRLLEVNKNGPQDQEGKP